MTLGLQYPADGRLRALPIDRILQPKCHPVIARSEGKTVSKVQGSNLLIVLDKCLPRLQRLLGSMFRNATRRLFRWHRRCRQVRCHVVVCVPHSCSQSLASRMGRSDHLPPRAFVSTTASPPETYTLSLHDLFICHVAERPDRRLTSDI